MTIKQIKKLSNIQVQIEQREVKKELECRMAMGISDFGILGNTFAYLTRELQQRNLEPLDG